MSVAACDLSKVASEKLLLRSIACQKLKRPRFSQLDRFHFPHSVSSGCKPQEALAKCCPAQLAASVYKGTFAPDRPHRRIEGVLWRYRGCVRACRVPQAGLELFLGGMASSRVAPELHCEGTHLLFPAKDRCYSRTRAQMHVLVCSHRTRFSEPLRDRGYSRRWR